MEEETVSKQPLPEQPVAQPTPEIHSEPVGGPEESKKDWLKIGLLVLAGLVLLFGAACAGYWYASQKEVLFSKVTPTPIPKTTTPSPSKDTEASITKFQQFLSENCGEIPKKNGPYYQIDPNKLPVSIDQTKFEIKSIYCPGLQGSNYIDINFLEKDRLFLYDERSKELGHGGYSFFDFPESAQVIKDIPGEVRFAVYLSGPEGPRLVGNTNVVMRGRKRLLVYKGKSLYVVTSLVAINNDDPRLIEFLNQYSEESETYPGSREILYSSELERKIAERFFSNLEVLENPEKESLDKIETVLSAITVK